LLENLRLLEATNQELTSARVDLLQLINLPLSSDVRVAEPAAAPGRAILELPVEQLEDLAASRNADHREQFYNVRVANNEARKAISRLYPNLTYNMGNKYSTDGYLINQNWNEAGLQLSFNLFNLISGFTAPSSGEVRLKGERIDGLTPHDIARRGIGRTFQNLRIFPNMSVFDNVTVGAIGHETIGLGSIFPWQKAKSDRITQKSFAALEAVGLLAEADDLAANISYGKRKYLEIARALAMQPELLILDEPAVPGTYQ
jgi:hypothetical protein